MNLGHRLTGSVLFEWFLLTAASAMAFVGFSLRASLKMSDQKVTGTPKPGRVSPQELIQMRWPINERFAAALEEIRRGYVPEPSPDAPSELASAKPSANLQR